MAKTRSWGSSDPRLAVSGRRWNSQDARSVLARWRRSGLSAEQFAREHGLNPQRLSWWRKQLEGGAQAAVSFVPAELVAVAGTRSAGTGLLLRLPGGVTIEAQDAAALTPSWVASLVSEMGRAT